MENDFVVFCDFFFENVNFEKNHENFKKLKFMENVNFVKINVKNVNI